MGVALIFRMLGYLIYSYLQAFVHLFKPPSKKSIEGEIVLVTGAGHGIGKQLALDLSKLGTTMVVWDLNKENNEQTAEEINKAGGKAFPYVCDVTNTSQIATVAAKVREDVGEVTILVNNAGILNGGYLMDMDEKAIRRTFDVNILSHFWMIKEFLPNMMKNNKGHILNVSSMSAILPPPCLTDYGASKAAVVNFGQSLAAELSVQGYKGIRLSTLCPMIVDTGMLKNFQNDLNPILTTEETSRVAIDGLLREYPLITVPTSQWLAVKLGGLLPDRAQNLVFDFGLIKISPQYKKEN